MAAMRISQLPAVNPQRYTFIRVDDSSADPSPIVGGKAARQTEPDISGICFFLMSQGKSLCEDTENPNKNITQAPKKLQILEVVNHKRLSIWSLSTSL